MAFLQLLFAVAYLGTPVALIGVWIGLARSGRRVWPAPAAIGMWLLQAAVLAYFIGGCLSGHCTLTPLEEHGPVVLMVAAYLGIAALLWYAYTRTRR